MPPLNPNVPIQPIQSGGHSEAAESLMGVMRQRKENAIIKAQKSAEERGARLGSRELLQRENGVLQAPKQIGALIPGSVEAKAYDNALLGAYTAEMRTDVRDNINRLMLKYPTDLAGFEESASKYMATVMKSVPDRYKQQVQAEFNHRIGSASLSVQQQQISKNKKIAAEKMELEEKMSGDSAATFARKGDLVSASLEIGALKENLLRQVAAANITPAAAEEKLRIEQVRVIGESLVGELTTYTATGDFDKVFDAISSFSKKIPDGMTLAEHEGMKAAMMSAVNSSLLIKNKQDEFTEKEKNRQMDAKRDDLFLGVISGNKGATSIIDALAKKQIDSDRVAPIITALQTRGRGVTDWGLKMYVEEMVRKGDDPEEIKNTIMQNAGSRLTEESAEELMTYLDNYTTNESKLKESRVVRARDFVSLIVKNVGMLGFMDDDAKVRLANSIREFDEMVLEGQDPFDVADNLVKKDSLEKMPEPLFGSNQDPVEAKRLLNEALANGTVSKADYDSYAPMLDRAYEILKTVERFNAAYEQDRKNRKQNANR